MYFKVVAIAFLSIFLSGCSFFSSPKPNKKPDVKVVEEIENNTTEANITVAENTTAKTIDEKYGLKPEPFSLESHEEDPELLGPQTTLDRDLVDSGKKEAKKENKKPNQNSKNSNDKANKKETI